MGRVLAIDYGLKRIGIAVTDPLKIIAQPLTTVNAADIYPFLDQYFTP
jgi:putative Holliday junction resolvase